MRNLAGESIGRYQIIEQLGQGGMAVVYKAYDTRLERDVAIKIIRTEQFAPSILEGVLKRFEREAKALARLSHQNIVKVYDYGEYDGKPYLVIEYLPGGTLKKRTEQAMPWQEAMRTLLPIASALDYAHSEHILHRDIKPSNILLTKSGQLMLSDFGIARILEDQGEQTLTGTGVGVGTPEYMAPEQWIGKAGPASDQYSLGVVLYEMITGHLPYNADTPAAILLKQVNDPLPRPRQYIVDLPENVEKVLFKVLAKKPEDRYASMAEFGAALEKLVTEKPEKKPAKPPKESKEPEPLVQHTVIVTPTPAGSVAAGKNAAPKKTKPWLAWGIGGILVVAIAAAGIALALRDRDKRESLARQLTDMPTLTAVIATSDPTTPVPQPTALPSSTLKSSPTLTLSPTAAPSASFTPHIAMGTVTVDSAYLRTGPASNYPTLGVVNKGESLQILARNQAGDWLVVLKGSIEGWIIASALETEEPLSPLPVYTAQPTPVPSDTPTLTDTVTPITVKRTSPPILPTSTPPPPPATRTPTFGPTAPPTAPPTITPAGT
jgi:eukaryotic-like serine/threonine-protein kinase